MILFTIPDTIEQSIFTQPTGQSFSAASVDDGTHLHRAWCYLAELAQKRHKRADRAVLVMNENYRSFTWIRQEA